jgi:two-component system, cell cycle sensor histidine kinase and response regulator CckA
MFRRLIDGTNDGIQVLDPETHRLLDVNETSCHALGYTRDELLKLTIFDIDPNSRELVSREACRPASGRDGIIFESRHRRKDGSTFPVEINIKFVKLDRGYIVTVVRDLTQRE